MSRNYLAALAALYFAGAISWLMHHVAGTTSPWIALPLMCLCAAGFALTANAAWHYTPTQQADDEDGYWGWRDEEDAP